MPDATVPVNAPAAADAPLAAYLSRADLADARVVPLSGDASDRRYYRVIRADGTHSVVALHASPFEFGTLPFVIVQTLLARMPVPVPRIIGHAGDLGVIELEDLGDVTLQTYLATASRPAREAIYREAVGHLDVIQRRGRELSDARPVPYGVAFDTARLGWEMDFFVKHFLEAYRGLRPGPAVRQALSVELNGIVGELAAEPRVLCHRDYHSRNLMLSRGRLSIIDFQDARMGPDTYDLVSLVCDSYVDVPSDLADALITQYLALQGRSAEGADYRRRFTVTAVQRTLKALGTFGYQTTARGNPVYVQYVPRTLGTVRALLFSDPRFERLGEILAGFLPELA